VQVRVYQNPTALFDVVPKIIYLPGERPSSSTAPKMPATTCGTWATAAPTAILPPITPTPNPASTPLTDRHKPRGCEDSYQMHEVLKVEVGGELAFPNAFTPDPSGPSGGRYEFGDPRNTVFYPPPKGRKRIPLADLHPLGELVFESKDVEIGWDGYHNKRLAPRRLHLAGTIQNRRWPHEHPCRRRHPDQISNGRKRVDMSDGKMENDPGSLYESQHTAAGSGTDLHFSQFYAAPCT